MFIESIRFKRTKESDWEDGLYIGDSPVGTKYANCTVVDSEYEPLPIIKNEFDIKLIDCYKLEEHPHNSFYVCTNDDI